MSKLWLIKLRIKETSNLIFNDFIKSKILWFGVGWIDWMLVPDADLVFAKGGPLLGDRFYEGPQNRQAHCKNEAFLLGGCCKNNFEAFEASILGLILKIIFRFHSWTWGAHGRWSLKWFLWEIHWASYFELKSSYPLIIFCFNIKWRNFKWNFKGFVYEL